MNVPSWCPATRETTTSRPASKSPASLDTFFVSDASGHGTSNLPILLAGGGWKHGSHIAGDTGNNTPLGKLFVSMLQRFGVQTDTFGSGTGTIDGLV